MDISEITWLVVAGVALLAIVAVALLLVGRRRQHGDERRLRHADQLRHEAAGHTDDVRRTHERAAQAHAEAERARAEAHRAEQAAAAAHQEAVLEQARQEDVVREADRLDPRVDHTAADYRPTTDPLALKDPLDTPDRTGDLTGDPTGERQDVER